MKRFITTVLLWIPLWAFASSDSPSAICFADLPGEENIPLDTPGRIAISELAISSTGEKAYIATEYIGTANLQAEVYLLVNGKYCLAGELGSVVDFRANPKAISQGRFGLIAESKSGSDHFVRSFRFSSGKYIFSECHISSGKSESRKCTNGER